MCIQTVLGITWNNNLFSSYPKSNNRLISVTLVTQYVNSQRKRPIHFLTITHLCTHKFTVMTVTPAKLKSGFAALMDDERSDNDDIETQDSEKFIEPVKKEKREKKRTKLIAFSHNSDDDNANVVKLEDCPDSDNEKVQSIMLIPTYPISF